MKSFKLILLYFAIFLLFENFTTSNAITYGEIATPHSVPYQVLLNFTDSAGTTQKICGGSLISSNYVLTAGSCCNNAAKVEIILGANNISEIESTQVRVTSSNFTLHQEFNINEGSLPENDIALIFLENPIPTDDNIKVATLFSQNDSDSTGKIARVCGWGKTDFFNENSYSSVLLYSEDQIITNDECRESFYQVNDNQICTAGITDAVPCTGDFGSPLIVDDVQIGIASFTQMFCMPGYPTVYTRVTSFLCWIEEHSDIFLGCNSGTTSTSPADSRTKVTNVVSTSSLGNSTKAKAKPSTTSIASVNTESTGTSSTASSNTGSSTSARSLPHTNASTLSLKGSSLIFQVLILIFFVIVI